MREIYRFTTGGYSSRYAVILLLLLHVACYREQVRPVTAAFSYTLVNDNYMAPAVLKPENQCVGADYFLWTFEGAVPSTSSNKYPGNIHYDQPGIYAIKLEAWNTDERREITHVIHIDSVMVSQFDVVFTDGDTAPAIVNVINRSAGASSCSWSFAGAVPSEQAVSHPLPVYYAEGGVYEIILTASNGRVTQTVVRPIDLKPRLAAAFDIVPSDNSTDFQVPFRATLTNRSISASQHQWSCQGATINGAEEEQAQLYIDTPGTYTIVLDASNSKETQSTEQTIIVYPNTNIYTFQDLKFGIIRAGDIIGYAFSAKLRKVVKRSDFAAVNGADIDILFMGLNAAFDMCRFVSPDNAAYYSLGVLAGAQRTVIINKQAGLGCPYLSPVAFDAMINDEPLCAMDIVSYDSGMAYFTGGEGERVVLFETQDGRKGAVKICSFHNEDDDNAYIRCTIKIQKVAR